MLRQLLAVSRQHMYLGQVQWNWFMLRPIIDLSDRLDNPRQGSKVQGEIRSVPPQMWAKNGSENRLGKKRSTWSAQPC